MNFQPATYYKPKKLTIASETGKRSPSIRYVEIFHSVELDRGWYQLVRNRGNLEIRSGAGGTRRFDGTHIYNSDISVWFLRSSLKKGDQGPSKDIWADIAGGNIGIRHDSNNLRGAYLTIAKVVTPRRGRESYPQEQGRKNDWRTTVRTDFIRSCDPRSRVQTIV